ncbi:MAG: AAA family ATPase [bacterium]
MSSWFIAYQKSRAAGDTAKLWSVFQLALQDFPLKNQAFLEAFDDALTVRQTNVNLTMGLFWIRPDTFLNLDQTNREYLQIKLPRGGLTAKFFAETVQAIKAKGQSFPELSSSAWLAGTEQAEPRKIAVAAPSESKSDGVNYWLVGAYWDNRDPTDQTQRFLDEGIWENGYEDSYLDEVKSMKVNDKIAIKAAATQKKNLPFDAQGQTVSRLVIKAIGTIVSNRNDGRAVEVEWDHDFKEKQWYFYTNRSTVWRLRTEKDYRFREYAEKLIRFVWYGEEQEYDWFYKRWWNGDKTAKASVAEEPEVARKPYGIEDIVASGVFLAEDELSQLLERLRSKKATILQGAPGVGKTFLARKLAHALMGEVADERIEMVQFHQSYSYDDFVRGYRPLPGKGGTFGLQNGVFYDFCQKALHDPDREYVFIIDEINRGNLSQVFGELLMLIEHDKRGKEFSVPLVYRDHPDEPRFYVPTNLYLIGLMNLADRSLAMVDYALRRRFAFFTLMPQFESRTFRQWLLGRSMDAPLAQLIIERMTTLNKVIREDSLLGENYQIGHSFFCPKGDSFVGLDKHWYYGIVRTEIVPLLKEYWFDNPKKAEEAEKEMLAQ